MAYVCLYSSYLDTLAPFSDAERGRLMMAMLIYSTTGDVPELDGNERFIWPTIQSQIDRDKAAYNKKCERNRSNGAKGGRPKNPTVFPETQKTERLFEKPKKPKEKEKEKEKAKEKENNNIYTLVISYLNEKAGTKYKATAAKTKTAIHARVADGFTLDDFKTVIDKKCAEWIGSDFEKYLRPETLFGTKFEGYLNANTTGRMNTNGQTSGDSSKVRIGNYI